MSKATMSEEIKAQVQKVYECRLAENAAWRKQKAAEPRTPEWGQAVEELEHATHVTTREERHLAKLLIEEVLGKVTY